ncbi:hypothetical protein GGD89_000240 [Roseospira visakhapatnamensis]|uniref:Uncharacterized protein n=1 Tax=Roseospira visakhapatnamensis TaxID=390880 RepID=A0A7W6W8A1_9PROT|nr:hypothetical protein [Roseospira visakhapatnamensis]
MRTGNLFLGIAPPCLWLAVHWGTAPEGGDV